MSSRFSAGKGRLNTVTFLRDQTVAFPGCRNYQFGGLKVILRVQMYWTNSTQPRIPLKPWGLFYGILVAADWDASRRPARAQLGRFSCLLASARTVFSFDCSGAEPRTQQPPEPAALLAARGRAGCGDVSFQQSRRENGFRPCATAAVKRQKTDA